MAEPPRPSPSRLRAPSVGRDDEHERRGHDQDTTATQGSLSNGLTAAERERLEAALASERRLVALRQALESLTIVSETATDFGRLADATVTQVISILGGRFGAYADVEPGQPMTYVTVVGAPAGFDVQRFEELTGLRAFVETRGPCLHAIDAAHNQTETRGPAAPTAYVTLPVHDDGRLAAAIIVYFDSPPGTLRIEQRELDAVARIASISLSNFRLRERLVASEARYRTLFEESPEPLILATSEGVVTDANEASVALFGGDRGWLVGRALEQLIEWGADVRDDRLLEHGRSGRVAFRGHGTESAGGRFPYEVVVHRVDVGGEERLLLLIRDLTDEQRLQQELVQAQKMEAIGMLVSGVAHELNNPLTAIVAFSQILNGDERLPEDLRDNAQFLVQEANRTRRIVGNLLDFARQRPPERHPTPLDVLVRNVLDLQSYSLGSSAVSVEVDIPEDLPPVELDRAQMQQVLLNLTLNAIQSIQGTSAPGVIRVAARRRTRSDGEEAVRVSVTDNGPGVAEGLRGRLFLPFFSTKEPGKGTGLGLSVSFGIVAAHGGRLWFESPREGGARFVIELPVRAANGAGNGGTKAEAASVEGGNAGRPNGELGGAAQAEAAKAEAARAEAANREPGVSAEGGRRPRILVLDDESAIRALLGRMIGNAGWEPILAGEGREALAAIERERVDVLLVDHRMAGMSGTEVFGAIVERRPELAGRFILMTGDVLNSELRSFVRTHPVRLLAKPFDLASAQLVIGELLAEAGLAEAGSQPGAG